MAQISDRSLACLRDLFRSHLEDVLDDPSYMLHPDETTPPAEEVASLKETCLDLGLDWDGILAAASEYERERLLALGRGEDLRDWGPRYKEACRERDRRALRESVRETLADPSWMLEADRLFEPAKEIAVLRYRAKKLDLAWDELISVGSAEERQRLDDIENGVIEPAPLDPITADSAARRRRRLVNQD